MAKTSEERTIEIVVNGQKANASLKEMGAAAAVLSNQVRKIAADDPNRAALVAQLQEMRQRIAATTAEVNGLTQSEEQLAVAAAELAQQNQQTIATGKAAGASFNEMKAAAGQLEKQLHELSQDDPGRAAMIADFQHLKARMAEARDEMEKTRKSEAQLKQEQDELRESNHQLVVNGQKVSASMKDMGQAAAVLERELEELSRTDPGWAAKAKELKEMRQRIAEVSEEAGKVGESTSVWAQAFATAGLTVGMEAVVDVVKEVGQAVAETTQEFLTLRSSINTLTGATGPQLDTLTAQVAGIAKTFGKENQEVLLAANTLSKQMDVSQQEALRLISQGFLAGADASGEFLDQVKEYPTQFKAAGLSASEAIAVISQSVTTGVFSDKGADVIKEFGLRIREQTSTTSDAMVAAFGEPFTQKIFDGINKGTLSTTEALRMVAKEMDETNVPANRLQTVIADVFGGPGEDAGIDFLKSLKNVGTSIDELVDSTNTYTRQQQALLASEQELAAAQNGLAKEFEGSSNSLTTLGNQAKTVGYTLLMSLVVTFKELFQPLQEIWTSFVKLGQQLRIFGGEGLTAKAVGEGLGAMFRLIWTPARLLYQAISWVVGGITEWIVASPKLITFLKAYTAPLQIFFDMLLHAPAYFEGFKAAAFATFGSVGRIISAAFRGNFAEAKAEFMNMGNGAGKAFLDAYHKQIAEADAAAAAEPAMEEEEKPKRNADGDGQTAKDKAKAEKERLAKLKKDQADREKAAKEAEEAERRHQEMLYNLAEAAVMRQGDLRKAELAKIQFDAMRKALLVKGTEQERNAAIALINEEAQEKMRAKQAEWDKKDADEKEKLQDAYLKQILGDIEETMTRKESALEVMREAGLLSEQAYQDQLYEVQREGLQKQLDLLEKAGKGQSDEARKIRSALAETEKKGTLASIKNVQDAEKKKQALQEYGVKVAGDVISTGIQLLGQDEEARKKHHTLYVGLSAAKILMDGYQEVASIWRYSAENPANGMSMGAAGIILGGIQTALAVGRTMMAISNLNDMPGYAAGGATGDGMVVSPGTGRRVSPWSAMMEYSGISIGSNGKLTDGSGFAVAGVVHEDEYVIPKWLRQDPQVAAFEEWVEAKRMRGFYTGGRTSDSGPASVDQVFADLGSDGATTGLLTDMLGEMRTMNGRLAGVESWQRQLQVNFDVHGHRKVTAELKQVEFDSAIRKSPK
ncbi:phage tail tape measure protein [Hymenobacter sp. ASUV-10]|uniref:Phage tail tape measure protein n=1 Tax=Hymenobacter aranciens TaxID=3063996 RepID=A0ABT9BCM2_9BACT|nr:phage tail tape measure protein [Hymenobacter sp. ASUV-10]MDO7875988.1 phage tail tape measure protein [Hymenobacter sp. ASUV-10]